MRGRRRRWKLVVPGAAVAVLAGAAYVVLGPDDSGASGELTCPTDFRVEAQGILAPDAEPHATAEAAAAAGASDLLGEALPVAAVPGEPLEFAATDAAGAVVGIVHVEEFDGGYIAHGATACQFPPSEYPRIGQGGGE